MQPAPLLTVAVHVVVEPAGVLAPSMKTAAPVVPEEMYSGLRTRLALGFGGTRNVSVPYAVAAGGLALSCATWFGTAELLELPPVQALRHAPKATVMNLIAGSKYLSFTYRWFRPNCPRASTSEKETKRMSHLRRLYSNEPPK